MIRSTRKDNYVLSLSNGVHTINSDVEKEVGGTGQGLNAHELLEAALTSCTAQTLLIYAGRKNWDLKDLKVEVKILQEGPESLLNVAIEFGDIPEEQKTRLKEIAKKCPIHKLLTSNVRIDVHAE